MKYRYGDIPKQQMSRYKDKLHKRIFWLLLYKDPNTKEKFPNVDYDKYVEFFMKELDGFNSLFKYPASMVQILSLIEASYIEANKEDFDFKTYRKLILDAQSLVDKLCSERSG